jgi:hypothetical protein
MIGCQNENFISFPENKFEYPENNHPAFPFHPRPSKKKPTDTKPKRRNAPSPNRIFPAEEPGKATYATLLLNLSYMLKAQKPGVPPERPEPHKTPQPNIPDQPDKPIPPERPDRPYQPDQPSKPDQPMHPNRPPSPNQPVA